MIAKDGKRSNELEITLTHKKLSFPLFMIKRSN